MPNGMNKVVVTGFGPFGTHKINSSWEVAKDLTNLGLNCCGINLMIEEIPVSYETVLREVPNIWEETSPKLVVHLGVSCSCREIKIETIAHKSGYCKPDIDGSCPSNGCCNGRDEVICNQLDLVNVIKKVNENTDVQVPVSISADAGRYVCEFTYYTSLNVNCHRAVFVHVPDIDKPYSVRAMAICVKYIILALLEEISKANDYLKTKI